MIIVFSLVKINLPVYKIILDMHFATKSLLEKTYPMPVIDIIIFFVDFLYAVFLLHFEQNQSP
jgi:hypothetical protein